MKIPVLKLGKILLTSIQENLTDHDALELQETLLQEVNDKEAKGLVIDISAMEMVDSYLARIINDTASMAQLLGTSVVLCGMQPAVALTLVEMGRELIGVETALDLDQGMDKVRRLINTDNYSDAATKI